MGRLVKCSFCEYQVDKDVSVRYNNKNFHAACAEKQKDKDDLVEYICRLFGLKRPGPTVYSQLKNFMEKYSHYTFKGVKNALIYFYEVQKNSTKNSKQGIGIVPYIYDEAFQYFSKLGNKQNKIKESLNKQLDKEVQVIKATEKKETNKKFIDLTLID